MKLHEEQMEMFSESAETEFGARMVAHLERCFPESCGQLGRSKVVESVQTGIDRAAKYSIMIEYDVARYIDLMYVLCQDFDTNRETPWAREILNDQELAPRDKMDQLYRRTEDELNELLAREQGQD